MCGGSPSIKGLLTPPYLPSPAVPMTLSFKIGDPRNDFLQKRNVTTSRYEEYFLSDDEADLTITFGDLSMPGHAFVFEDRCPKMFEYYDMGEYDRREIEIDDENCTEDAVMTILRFIYRGDIVFDADDLEDVLHLARIYQLDDLFERLTSYPNFEELWKEYAWSFLSFVVDSCDEDSFHERVWEKIEKEAEALVALDGFDDLSDDVIEKILLNDDVRAQETTLFNACLRWASAKCRKRGWKDVAANRRKVMNPFIHHIRFPIMSLTEFSAGPAISGVLHLSEVRAIERAIESGCSNGTGFDSKLRARPALVIPVRTPVVVRQTFRQVIEAQREVSVVRVPCIVCFEGEVGIRFDPCGHVVVCRTCSQRLNECPVCREKINLKQLSYLS